AACNVKKEGVEVKPEIMIPLVGHVNELKDQEKLVREVAKDVFAKAGIKVDYLVGTMIELPRAALTADEIATVAEFFSYGTNDLTQTTFGLSRDDAGKFLPDYFRREILPADPFERIDQAGVGKLVKMGVELGRTTRPKLKIGICGEHGGEPTSVEFCHRTNLDYVSCSPFRIPIARLAAGQAAVREGATVSGRPAKAAAKAAAKPTPKKAAPKAKPAPKAKVPAKKAARVKAPAKVAKKVAKPAPKRAAKPAPRKPAKKAPAKKGRK
ncbi:MAG TPA: pyruvate, phosphate dikinase, partial [Thermoanaerobaculia bacterium]|nr:pyruvate, phosphate dikinase [Thermoanaerobaculia bacterium]